MKLLQVMPSDMISCILQQAEIIRLLRLSTTSTFHSPAFFCCLMTSLRISAEKSSHKVRLEQICPIHVGVCKNKGKCKVVPKHCHVVVVFSRHIFSANFSDRERRRLNQQRVDVISLCMLMDNWIRKSEHIWKNCSMCSEDDLSTNKQRPYYGLVIGKYCTNCLSIYLNSQSEKKSIALITTISSKKS